MTTAVVLSPATSVLRDRRDAGRALRVTWHGSDDLFVLSTWRDEVCASTFQLRRSDVPALIAALARGLAESPSAWSVAREEVTPRRIAALDRIVRRLRPHPRRGA